MIEQSLIVLIILASVVRDVRRNRKGIARSTLRESAIALAGAFVIMVLLASLAIRAHGPIQSRMRVDAAKCQLGIFEQAAEKYQLEVGSPPPNLDAVRTEPAGLPPGKWFGPYLSKEIPLDPWGHPYQYLRPGKHFSNGFDVWTVSPKGEEIGNWNISGIDESPAGSGQPPATHS